MPDTYAMICERCHFSSDAMKTRLKSSEYERQLSVSRSTKPNNPSCAESPLDHTSFAGTKPIWILMKSQPVELSSRRQAQLTSGATSNGNHPLRQRQRGIRPMAALRGVCCHQLSLVGCRKLGITKYRKPKTEKEATGARARSEWRQVMIRG